MSNTMSNTMSNRHGISLCKIQWYVTIKTGLLRWYIVTANNSFKFIELDVLNVKILISSNKFCVQCLRI